MERIAHASCSSRAAVLPGEPSLEAFTTARPYHAEDADRFGLEAEFSICAAGGKFMPAAPEILSEVQPALAEDLHGASASQEFTACQIELQTMPERTLYPCIDKIVKGHSVANAIAASQGLELVACELAPEDAVPYVCYPDPRYRAIMEEFSRARVEAMFRVASWQISIGVGSWHEAIEVRNALVKALPSFFAREDWINPGRRRLYEEVIFPHSREQIIYQSICDAYEHARSKGIRVVMNPSFDWDHVTLKPGRVEFRPIGAISGDDPEKMQEIGEAVLAVVGR